MGKNKQRERGIPSKFTERLTEMFGVSLSAEISKTFVARPTTFRVNTLKARKEEIIEILNQNGFKFERVLWYKDSFVLKNKTKRELTDLEIYKQGKIYIQSLASMVPPMVLQPQPGEKVLDLTAAPGSKTSQIAALMNGEGELIANDNNKIRFFKLKHNMEMLGVSKPHPNPPLIGEGKDISSPYEGEVRRGFVFSLRMEHGSDLAREYPEYFDKILLDAPCSAEARFIDGDSETYGYWKEQKIKEMAYKQRQLLFAAWGALKPGGIMVYSTCTFAPEENEIQVTRLIEQYTNCEVLPIDLGLKKIAINSKFKNKEMNKDVIKKALRIMPTKEIEGFFVVKLMKKS
ncbi:MAG: Ribosomal RNA small subunit methyltransferase B [Candidatus Magasanikbacteria bacterium GW2011_GWC2_37_14]|uniref:Ribosomal RNA small subunit methyltransferase B n=1 Tax=Candidatus Magasanikbacteria bacterium GW2011_GWC2_37_14 TaxID=1619046 RepID=A0A0G0ISM6_9BACT|nr:MAG: Ribosomal RNA small subunit methyltransferase B [Candidatus Magasanikbacteria bacterium GW2011_GWC2_37_14]